MISGFSVLCCAKTDDLTPKQRYISSLVVVVIGVLQLLMVSCFLIGWIWSGIWGVSLIGNSGKIITIYTENIKVCSKLDFQWVSISFNQ